jgi:hypothetical protein
MANTPLLAQTGQVLQTVQNSVSISDSTTSGATYIISGLTCQITPIITNSKFLVSGTALINSRAATYGFTAKIMVRNLTTASAWSDFAMGPSCDSHGIGSYADIDTDQWTSSGFTLFGSSPVSYSAGQILQFAVWIRASGIGTPGSTTCRFGHPNRTSNMVITEILG